MIKDYNQAQNKQESKNSEKFYKKASTRLYKQLKMLNIMSSYRFYKVNYVV
jgi:hypothetical protein